MNFGKQFRQDNRVYDSDHVAMCLTAQPLGNAGGYSYLYIVKPNFNNPSIRENSDGGRIIRIGNVSTGKSQVGMVYDSDGLFPTLCACTHGYAIGYILDNRRIKNNE